MLAIMSEDIRNVQLGFHAVIMSRELFVFARKGASKIFKTT